MKRCAVCSAGLREDAASSLVSAGYEVIYLPPHPALERPVAAHADMIFRILDDFIFFDKIYAESYPDVVKAIASADGFVTVVTEDSVGAKYPDDVKFNVLVGEKFAAAKQDAVSLSIFEKIKSSGREFVPVNQGYAACSCLLAKDALVTADRGIASALEKYVDTLLISQNSIALPPYDAGFIGGASGFDGERAFFVGDVARHPDGKAIVSFLEKHGVEAVSLTDGELFDVGGIVFI